LIGIDYWNEFQEIKNSDAYTDENKLELLKNAASFGSEEAVSYISFVYRYGLYGLQENDPKGLELAQQYAKKGSEMAICHFLGAYERDSYGLQKYDPEVFKLVTRLAIDGNSRALEIFNKHNDNVKPNFKCNDNLVRFSDVNILFNN